LIDRSIDRLIENLLTSFNMNCMNSCFYKKLLMHCSMCCRGQSSQFQLMITASQPCHSTRLETELQLPRRR